MDYSTKLRLKMATNSQIDEEPWESDVISLMADQLEKYKEIAGCELPKKYQYPVRRQLSLCELLKEDLEYFSKHVPDVEKLRDNIEIFQFHGNTPRVSVLLPEQEDGIAHIGISTTFMKFVHLYFSKFMTLTQTYREDNIHEDYLEEIKTQKWDCLSIYLSTLVDAAKYTKLDYESAIEKYRYLYQPYDYCDLIIAARQFGLLHEVAHLHIKKNFCQYKYTISPHGEEYLADQIAYEWLVTPYMKKQKLSDSDRYDLSIRIQAPFYYFTAEHFPFSIHHWDSDKVDVLRKKEKDYYRIQPLRREMSLMGGMQNQTIFRKYPDMLHYLYIYISKEHIAHDPDTFFRGEWGPLGMLGFTQQSDELHTIIQSLLMSRADAYHAYSELDYAIALNHGDALAWLQQRLISFYRNENKWNESQTKEAWLEVDRIIKRRMGLMKDYGALDKVLYEHEVLFGEAPIRCYDISKIAWKKRYGIMQIDLVVVSETEKSEVIDIIKNQDRYDISADGFQEIRNLDGDIPMLLFNISADFVNGTSAGLFAAFIYDFLKAIRAKRVRIAEEDIDLIKETVENTVISTIERALVEGVSKDIGNNTKD